MKKIQILLVIMILISTASAIAGSNEDVANTLYRYYQADKEEDLGTMLDLTDTSFLEGSEKTQYRLDMATLYENLFKIYDTKSFEITDADIFSDGTNARVFYHLKSEVVAVTGKSYNINNAYVAVLYDEGNGWKVSYVMPRMEYEIRKAAMAKLDAEIEAIELTEEDMPEPPSEPDGGVFGFFVNVLKKIFTALTDQIEVDVETVATKDCNKLKEDYAKILRGSRESNHVSDASVRAAKARYEQCIGKTVEQGSSPSVSNSEKAKQQAYTEYVDSYNYLQDLMTAGKGDTEEAQEAYDDYKEKKAKYESMTGGGSSDSKSDAISNDISDSKSDSDIKEKPDECGYYCKHYNKEYVWRWKWDGEFIQENYDESAKGCEERCAKGKDEDYYKKIYNCMVKNFDSCYSTCQNECSTKGTYTYKKKDYEFECTNPKLNCASWCREDFCEGI